MNITQPQRATTVTLIDIFEDLDGDYIEDHLDDDMDGDGFTNEEELAIGSDPRSAIPLSLDDSNFHQAIQLWFDSSVMQLLSTDTSATGMFQGLLIWLWHFMKGLILMRISAGWDVSSVTNMTGIFTGPLPLTKQSAGGMFLQSLGCRECSILLIYSTSPIEMGCLLSWIWVLCLLRSQFQPTHRRVMYHRLLLHTGCLIKLLMFNQPLDEWNVSSIKNMDVDVWQASAFDQSLGNWDISSVTSSGLRDMFLGADNLSNENKGLIAMSFFKKMKIKGISGQGIYQLI